MEYVNKYKTEICKNYQLTGKCEYSFNCFYAHGEGELRDIKRPSKFKTTLCRNFEKGYCSYGSRCQFKHKVETKRYFYFNYLIRIESYKKPKRKISLLINNII